MEKFMRSKIYATVVAIAGLFVLVACGDSNTPQSAATVGVTVTAAPTATVQLATPTLAPATTIPTAAPTDTASPAIPTSPPAVTSLAGTPGTEASDSGGQCGTIQLRGSIPASDSASISAAACFEQAFQACRAEALTVTMMGVDTGATYVLTPTKSGGKCVVSGTFTHRVIPRPPVTETFTCTTFNQRGNLLLFNDCGTVDSLVVALSKAKTQGKIKSL